MSERKWFAIIDGQIKGPFEQQDLQGRLSSNDQGQILIWGRGQTEWIPPHQWTQNLQGLHDLGKHQDPSQAERLWRILADGVEHPPMNHEDMIRLLKSKTDLSHIRLWTEGYSEWRDIYQIHKIMDELGVSRRTYPRVPIMGTLVCEGAAGHFNGKLLSISEGGLGATESGAIKIGEKLKVIVKSPNLTAPIQATVEVVYVGMGGYFGTKFTALQSESQSLIIEYINKFLVLNPELR